MHISTRSAINPRYDYLLNGNVLDETVLEKDLGVYVTPDWKSAAHVAKVASKANQMVGRINRAFNYMNVEMFKAVYPGMIRSHMEYAVQTWSPHYAKDILLLEKVQRRATKLVHNLRDKPYEVRLAALDLTTLEERRKRGDLIQVFKIIHGFDKLKCDDFFKLHKNDRGPVTRGHEWKIKKPHTGTKSRKKFFDYRVINMWNELPANVVEKQTINSFKARLDRHMKLMRGDTSTSE